mmetsp:Transcript_1113/g.4087  ORF Transcript_1113/g.4087 Transcript_1113/m.4087 type:complete len:376 (-) Transcript_1113:371-1498(-)
MPDLGLTFFSTFFRAPAAAPTATTTSAPATAPATAPEDAPADASMAAAAAAPRRICIKRATSLERLIVGDKVSQHLDARPSLEDLRRRGITRHTAGCSRVLHRQRSDLERRLISQRLSAHLDGRDEAPPRRVSARLERPATALQFQITADRVRSGLSRRSSLVDLARRGVVSASDARLKAERYDDKAASACGSDADSERTPGRRRCAFGAERAVAPALHKARAKLARAMTRDQLSYLLIGRPDAEDLTTVLGGDGSLAHRIQAPRKQLDHNLRRASLSRSLSRRKSYDEISHLFREAAPEEISRRDYYRVALGAARRLFRGARDCDAKAALKDLVLDRDSRIVAAVDAFQATQSTEKLLDALLDALDGTARDARR